MSIASRLTNLASWKPIEPGAPAPNLSLTADEGTWIRMPDFKDHINVILLFFRSTRDDATDAWLKDFQRHRQQFEDLETAIFGVSTYRTDKLREYRNSLGVEYYLLYDPLAVDSRAFRASSRVRPIVKDTCVVVGKDGRIAWSERGRPDARTVLEVVARLEGAQLPTEGGEQAPADEPAFNAVRNPGQRAAEVQVISSETAVQMLGEQGSPYILVDVRTLSEFDADHAPQAVHIPVDELPHRYQELGQTDHVLFVCQAGGRSAAAAEFLTSIGGSEIYNVEGGMSAWTGPRVTGGEAQ